MSDTKLNGYTPDIAEENITALRNLFPDVCTEDKVDFEKLRQLLGEYVDEKKERYNFTWNGKGRALKLSQTPSRGTLLPCKEESKDWDSTENIYIEGDNLEVLKLLQKSYHNAVKMIYIDPPYNTGNDFVYPDDFSDSVKNYKQITGQVDAEGKNISTNPETNGRYHTDWLNMMYPRLRLARSLLRDDGVIFISIDDNEVANLQKVCDEVFGETNFVATFPWRKRTAKSDVPFGVSQDFENLLCYCKQNFVAAISGNGRRYYETPDFPNRPWRVHDLTKQTSAAERPNSYFTMINPKNGDEYPANSKATWRVTKDTFEKYYSEHRIVFPGDYDFLKISKPVFRYFKDDDQRKGGDLFGYVPLSTKLPDDVGMSLDGTKDFDKLFDGKLFSFPKPVGLIKYLIQAATSIQKDVIILDFFSGSATTAHAVMQLNAEDNGSRKYILVQLPELCDKKSEAYKAGYKTICDIGKERIRRAGDKIKSDLAVNFKGQKTLEGTSTLMNPEDLDIGFKVFKLDTSNIVEWNPTEDIKGTLAAYTDNYLHGRTELDVVYELLLKQGYPLTEQIEEKTLAGKHIYSIQNGKLLICLDDHITTELAREIAKEKLQAESRIIFKDNGFASDSDKINTLEILKAAGLSEEGFRTL